MPGLSRAAGATGPRENDMTGGLGDKAKDALNSDKGEQASDKALDKAGQAADQKSGGGHDAQIDKGRDLADGKIGNE
jgi:hypothetical protein